MSKRTMLGIAAVVAVAAVVVVLLLVLGGGDDEGGDTSTSRVPPSLPGPVTAGLGEGAADLLALLEGRDGARYHVVYEASLAGEAGTATTLEVWRVGPTVRTDTRVEAEGQLAESAAISEPDGGVSCNRPPDGEWACEQVAPEEAGELGALAGLTNELTGVEVTEGEGEAIAGRQARCFTFGSDGGPGEVCADAEGVVLRLSIGDTTLEAVTVDTDIPDGIFEPPAA